jgi:hypothetical protein
MDPELLSVLVGNQFAQLTFAGAVGGLVRWAVTRESWKSGLPAVGVGLVTAPIFGSAVIPLLAPVADFTNADPVAAVLMSGYVIGVGGLVLPMTIMDIIDKRRRMLRDDQFVGEVGEAHLPEPNPPIDGEPQ